jgi:serine protease Do
MPRIPRLNPTCPFLLFGALLGIPTGVWGQEPAFPQIQVGEEVGGFLGTGGPTIADRGPFTVYRFDAEGGIRYGVDLSSVDFDGYLILARPVGGITEFLRENDDGGGDTDARLRFTVEDSGPYLLIVQAYDLRTGGAYTLSVEERVVSPPQPPRSL